MCKDSAMTDPFGAELVSGEERHEVAVLALPHVVAFELGLPHRFLGGAVDDDGRPLYRVRTCTVDGGPIRTSAHYAVLPDHDAAILRTAQTIVIPGIVGGPPVVEGRLDPPVAAALARRRPDARLVSICTGAYVLAAAGVLDGRPATTHWMRTEPFCTFFPEVRLDPDVLYVDDGDVLTSAGVAAGIDLCLHMVRSDHGAGAANAVARRIVVAAHRDGGQAQFVERPMPKDGGGLAPTRAWMEEHLDRQLTVQDMARHAACSPRSFARRFRAETGTTPLQWLIGRRVAEAQRLLESTDLPVEHVAARAGFGTAAVLRQHFSRALATSPSAYRRAFGP
jgi:transcriptional regulator GlxA family with amidase domain